MAENWEFVASYEDVEFLGGSNTRDVLVTGIRTKPSGIYVEFRVAMADFRENGARVVHDAAHAWAATFEALAAMQWVAGVQWGQESYRGQLHDVAILTVQSTNGDAQSSVTIPLSQLDTAHVTAVVKKLHDQLDDIGA
jgi:hypothetical protein